MEKSITASLDLLFDKDAGLLEADVAERTIAARLANYLAEHFPQHHVDVEYNRHGLDIKQVRLPEGCRGGGLKRIFPDIIVHQRGHDKENLLVIQIKKETNHDSRDCDRAIIEAMKREFFYPHGLLIELPSGPDATKRKTRLEWL